ncbi:MAG: hypothetical protein ACYCXI_10410 [Dethiobacteraceae bacterium]
MKEAQELLRHENITTTVDIYSHVSIEMKQAAVNKLTSKGDLGKNCTRKFADPIKLGYTENKPKSKK